MNKAKTIPNCGCDCANEIHGECEGRGEIEKIPAPSPGDDKFMEYDHTVNGELEIGLKNLESRLKGLGIYKARRLGGGAAGRKMLVI